MAQHDIVCLHTMVGNLTGTDRMFKANGWTGTESHFGIGGKWGDGLDGVIYQWQDTDFQADANLEGSHRIISIETGDNAPRSPADIEPWTAKQLDAIVAVTTWACRKYDIPPVLIPDSKPSRRGIGYHRLGVPGFAVVGGEKWSLARGKECPGPQRIAQVPQIVARVKAALAGEEDDMKLTDDVDLTPQAAELLGKESATVRDLLQWPPGVRAARDDIEQVRVEQHDQGAAVLKALAGIDATLKDIAARLPAPPA
jgi:hypothetical protein